MATNSECLTSPLETVAGLFRATGSNKAGDWGVKAIFAEKLADPAILVQVQDSANRSCLSLNFCQIGLPPA